MSVVHREHSQYDSWGSAKLTVKPRAGRAPLSGIYRFSCSAIVTSIFVEAVNAKNTVLYPCKRVSLNNTTNIAKWTYIHGEASTLELPNGFGIIFQGPPEARFEAVVTHEGFGDASCCVVS